VTVGLLLAFRPPRRRKEVDRQHPRSARPNTSTCKVGTAFSTIRGVAGILAVPTLCWFFSRGAAERGQNTARSENERGKRER